MRGLVETIYYTNTSGVSEFLAVNMDDSRKIRMRGFLLCPKIGAKLCFEDLTKDPDGCTVFRKTYLLLAETFSRNQVSTQRVSANLEHTMALCSGVIAKVQDIGGRRLNRVLPNMDLWLHQQRHRLDL